MSAHPIPDGNPVSIFIGLCIFISELLGAIIAITSDGFIRWTSLGMVAFGLFINYVVNREGFNDGMKKWRKEIWMVIKEFLGR